jgi:hypothetical protein
MRFHVCAVAAALALAGCSSPNDLLKKDPAFFGHTTKSAQAYAQCVADSWRHQGEQVKMIKISNGYDVVDEGTLGISAALRVLEYANGKVEVRMATRTSFGSQDMVQSANLCL